ncbi:hypothetical protein Tco_1207838, partial [Tanacetum coccineum]
MAHNNNNNNNLPLTPLYHVKPTNRFDLLHFLHSFDNTSCFHRAIHNHRPREDYFVLMPRPLNAAGTEFMTITDDDGLGEWEVVDEPEQVPN